MFLGYQEDKIVMAADTREALENAPCIKFDRIEESSVDYELYEGEYITTVQAEERRAQKEKEERLADLHKQLDTLDLKAIRALRAISAGVGTEADTQKVAELESQAEYVRQQIRDLEK